MCVSAGEIFVAEIMRIENGDGMPGVPNTRLPNEI
jgi:hypothetical protein